MTISRAEEVNLLVTEVFQAFCDITEKNSNVVVQFRQAFTERSEIRELSEAQGENGLAFALAEFLGRRPPKSYLDPARYQVLTGVPPIDNFYIDEFKAALKKVADRDPRALELIKRHEHEYGCSLPDLLKALLVQYVDNKDAYPY